MKYGTIVMAVPGDSEAILQGQSHALTTMPLIKPPQLQGAPP